MIGGIAIIIGLVLMLIAEVLSEPACSISMIPGILGIVAVVGGMILLAFSLHWIISTISIIALIYLVYRFIG